MQQATTPSNTANSASAIETLRDSQKIAMADRAAPGWSLAIGAVLTFGSFLFLASLPIFSVFFHSRVIQDGQWILAPILVLVGMVPILGLLIFEYAYARALAGFRYVRALAAHRVLAAAAALTVLVLILVHPLTVLGVLVATGLGYLSLAGLGRFARRERMWDFIPEEAASILSGRDRVGFDIARQDADEHELSGTLHVIFTALALVIGYGTASYLTTTAVIAASAVSGIALMNALTAYFLLAYLRDRGKLPARLNRPAAKVEGIELAEDADAEEPGLVVKSLTAIRDDGRVLLSEVGFSIPPGSIFGITGETGSGKSLMLQALADPFGLPGINVRGRTTVNGFDLWDRTRGMNGVPAVYVPDQPIMLPASGAENLACFHDGPILEQGKRTLEQLVFSKEAVDEIVATPNAAYLPGMYRKALALARAFVLAPGLYLFDRPEDNLPEKQIGVLVNRLKEEAHLGRSVILVTDNRALLEACDKLIVMQAGRIVDFGTGEAIRTRQAAGWARFVGERSLDIEENLEVWIRSHFKRPGDEANRRKVSLVASELLALSCQAAGGFVDSQTLVFEFKHFIGHCVLSMQDDDPPLSSAALQKAQEDAANPPENARLSPLATVVTHASEVDASGELDRRILTVKIDTFDPRKSGARGADAKAHG